MLNVSTWTPISNAKQTALSVRRAARYAQGQKYIPTHRKIWRAMCAFITAAGIAIISSGTDQY